MTVVDRASAFAAHNAGPHPLRHIAIVGSRGFPSSYGGYETAVRHIARDWVSRGIRVTVYCRTRDQGARHWVAEGVDCRYTPGLDTRSLSTLSYGLTSSGHVAVRGRPDAALVLNVANGFWLPMLKAARIPTAVNTDGIEWERGKWNSLGKRVFLEGAKLSAKYADVLVCDSKAIGDVWQEKFGVPSTFVPYGAPVLEDVRGTRVEAIGITPGSYALAVARLIPENNVDLFLDAIERTSPRIPAVVVGSATYHSPLEQRLRKLDHAGTIRWLGHVDDQQLLTQLWANAAVYVHGHSVGGTNPALLQALGAGAPTIALDTVFNREVLDDCPDQLFRHSPDLLARRLNDVARHPAARAAFRENGRRIVRSRYAWPHVSDGYLGALHVARIASARAR